MTRLPRTLGALLAVLATLSVAGTAVAQKPRAERPTYATGERWILNDGVYDLVRIEKGVYIFAAGPGRELHLSRDLALVRVVHDGQDEWDFWPPPDIPWPLEVGKWKVTNTNVLYRTRPVTTQLGSAMSGARATVSVEAYEEIEVPVGRLQAFRIVTQVQIFGGVSGTVVTWYAPTLKRIVKLAGVQRLAAIPSLEIVSADTAPPAPAAAPSASAQPALAAPPVAAPPSMPPSARAPTALAVDDSLALALSSPVDGTRIEHDTVALAGLASSGRGVSRVVVTLNGVELTRIEPAATAPAIPVNIPLTLREGTNTLVVTASDGHGVTRQDVRTVHYERAIPLAVHVSYPTDQLRVAQDSTVVVASAASTRGVARMSVTVNGTEVPQEPGGATQRSRAITLPVKLREGVNVIVVGAAEPDGTTRLEPRTVIYERPPVAMAPAPAAPPPARAPSHDRWAVVVGVGRYDNREIPALRYAVADAEAVYQLLVGHAGFKKEHVLLLTDRAERKPTLRNIKWALGTFLARSAKKEDSVVIYFAGHGAPEVDTRGIERDGLAKYLIPADADPDDLYASAFPMDELQTIFGRIEAERVVAFLDACYSGAAGGRTFTSKKTRGSHVDELFLERLTRSKGRVIVTASRPAEVSIELRELGHGLFTYYLIEGLKGAADLNRDGIVSLQELYEYLEHQVSRKARAVGGNQHPVMKGEMEGVLPLAKAAR